MTEDLEQRIRTDLQGEAMSLRAPNDLWSRVRSEIDTAPHPRPFLRARWLATAGLALAGAAALLVLTVVAPRLGGDEPLDAGSILARAAEAAEDPSSVELESFTGIIETRGTVDIEGVDPEVERAFEQDLDNKETETARVWFVAPAQFRVEHSDGHLSLSDGELYSEYDPESNTYIRRPLRNSDTYGQFFLPNSFLRAFPGSLTNLADPSEDSSIVDDQVLLGREAYVIETRSPEGTSRLWIDKELYMVLRWEAQSITDGQNVEKIFGKETSFTFTFSMGYTSLEFDAPVPDELFEFTPPPGARRVEETETEAEDTEVLEIGATQEAP